MFIAINGQLGSGKSEICRILHERYGYTVFSTGKLQRQVANEMGISTLELNERCKKDPTLDHYIDQKLVEYAEQNRDKDIIFDSRMAWHFVPNTFKVHLLVSPAEAAARVFYNRISEEETYQSPEAAMRDLIGRRRVEAERYEMIYGVRMTDYANYDFLLDTTTLTPDEECRELMSAVRRWQLQPERQQVVISPKNIYPTKSARSLDLVWLAEYEAQYKESPDRVPPIELAVVNDALYIVNGHHRVMACCRAGLGRVDAALITAPATPSTELVAQWEAAAGFTFGYYPE